MGNQENPKSSGDTKNVEQSKIVNLCEDMNPHVHNAESYNKLTQQKQENHQSDKK